MMQYQLYNINNLTFHILKLLRTMNNSMSIKFGLRDEELGGNLNISQN